MSTNKEIAARGPSAVAESTDRMRVMTPPVDIFENPKELLLYADLPGVAKDAVALHFEKDQLTLEAKTPTVMYRREFTVSSGIDVEHTEASVQRGVLVVRLPKAKGLQTRQIKVLGG